MNTLTTALYANCKKVAFAIFFSMSSLQNPVAIAHGSDKPLRFCLLGWFFVFALFLETDGLDLV